MELASPAFVDGGTIPVRHSCEGADLSPPLAWLGAPAGTRSFAVLCDDPDAPAGTWHHWAIFAIPATTTALVEGVPAAAEVAGMRQAVNDFGRHGYGGPCPPKGHGAHHYHFRLLALDVPTLGLGDDADCREVASAARRHVLAETRLTGLFER
jgi:Raf kinase inhibitor-like YbhB/YbcL family protein